MALAVQHAVLVHAETAQPDRFPVEQQPGPVHPDGPDAHRQWVLVVAMPGVQPVQVRVGRAPRPGPGHGQHAVRAAAFGHDGPGRVPEPHRRRAGPGDVQVVGDLARRGPGVVRGGDGQAGDVAPRGGVEPDRAVQPRIVEEVVEVAHSLVPGRASGTPRRAGSWPCSARCRPAPSPAAVRRTGPGRSRRPRTACTRRCAQRPGCPRPTARRGGWPRHSAARSAGPATSPAPGPRAGTRRRPRARAPPPRSPGRCSWPGRPSPVRPAGPAATSGRRCPRPRRRNGTATARRGGGSPGCGCPGA